MERYIKKSRKHSHLSIEERGMTDGFLMLGMSISRIAAHLNRSESTISEEMHEALIRNAKKININTITYDNGTENALHETTSKLFGRSNLFCRLYCGKDKGSIENRNKILRQFLVERN